MHATLVQRPFTKPGWSFEMKLDGFRALARRQGDRVELISRNGNTLGAAFPEIVRALKSIPGNWVLDAELVVPDSKGRPSFDRVRRRAVMKLTKTIVDAVVKAPAALCLFDVLYAKNSDVRVLPLSERRELLRELVKPRQGLQIVSSIEGHGEAVFAKACERDLEGIVGKHDDSPYQRGKRPTWVKIKNADYSRQEALGFRA
jgi:bifunctional non-homologous end joining protein LigD